MNFGFGTKTINRDLESTTTHKLETLTKSNFIFLGKYRDLYCISIYLPFNYTTEKSLEKIKEELLKQSKNSYLKREVQGMNVASIEKHLRDLFPILRKQEKANNKINIGLFLSNEITKAFKVTKPIPFRIYVNDHFYLKNLTQEFNKETDLKNIEQIVSKETVLKDIRQIIKLSAKGEIEILFLTKGKDLYGELDEENDFVLTHEDQKSGSSLSNLAAIKTIINEGKVVILDQERMPIPTTAINAIKQ